MEVPTLVAAGKQPLLPSDESDTLIGSLGAGPGFQVADRPCHANKCEIQVQATQTTFDTQTQASHRKEKIPQPLHLL